MEFCHTDIFLHRAAAQKLAEFIQKRREKWVSPTDLSCVDKFENFEQELHTLVMALECEMVSEELGRYDVTAKEIEVDVADLVEPAHPAGWQLAAQEWDEVVRERTAQPGGEPQAFEDFERLRWNLFRYFDPDDIDRPSPLLDQLKWLELAGFSSVDVFWMRLGHAIFGGWKPG